MDDSPITSALTPSDEGPPLTFHCRDDALFVGTVDEEYICSIGRGVLVDPVMAPCQHEFCDSCIRESLQHRKECPLCRRPLQVEDLVKAYKTSRMVAKLDVLCDNGNTGCKWQGKWSDLEKHKEACPHEMVHCTFDTCPMGLMERHKLEEHIAQCPYRPVICQYCNKSLPGPTLSNHEAECPSRPVPCPQDCGDVVAQSQVEHHVKQECRSTLLSCPFAPHGCNAAQLRRSDLEEHLRTEVQSHLLFVCQKLTDQQSTIQTQETKIKKLLRRSVITVGPPGKFSFHSICAALEHAEPHDTIIVHGGVYRECLTITKPVTLIAEGDVLVENGSESNVVLMKEACKVIGFRLHQKSKNFFCVRVLTEEEDTLVEGCDITSDYFSCVQVDSHTNPMLRNNKIHGSKQCGILIKKSGRGRVYGNEIHSNSLSNVYVDAYANPTVRDNKIFNSSQHGVWIKPKGTGLYENNTIYGNAMSNVKVEDGAKPLLKRNLCTYSM